MERLELEIRRRYNGEWCFFIASGEGVEVKYEKAYSTEPKSAALIDLITMHVGVLGVGGRDNNMGKWATVGGIGGEASGEDSGDYAFDDYNSRGNWRVKPPPAYVLFCFIFFHIVALTSML